MKKTNCIMRTTGVFALFVALLAGLSSCSEDEGLVQSATPQQQNGGPLWMNGEPDPNQTWMTSVPVELDLTVAAPGTVTAQTIGQVNTIVLGAKKVSGKDVLLLDVPQGYGNSFGLVFDDGTPNKQYRRVALTGDLRQVESISFGASAASAAAPRKVATASSSNKQSSLYGESIIADMGYRNFGSWAWDDLALALQEGTDASKSMITVVDYELMAKGQIAAGGEYTADEIVDISFVYGYTGNNSSRVLGYYTHTAGTYADIEYHDISEVNSLDYLNGKAKVQYQLDGNEAVWYDANFDYTDGDGLPNIAKKKASNPVRRGDDAYNTLLVNQAYGDRITAVRGLTFHLEVPKGKVFGFYLKTTGALSADQKQRLLSIGVPDDRLPSNQLNFSLAKMNTGGKHRSAYAVYDNFTFMGMDDSADSSGDLDCNDITFALTNADGEPYRPEPTPETALTWTMGFENAGMDVDFDFNDVVLKVKPNQVAHTASVWLLAAGAERDTRVYFGDQLLGEVHSLFGVEPGVKVNTLEYEQRYEPVLLSSTLSWPDGYTMYTHRNLFNIRVTEDDGTESIISSDTMLGADGDVPQVLCVAGEWNWPKERQSVELAYPLIGNWGRNWSNQEFWDWYLKPNENYVYKYWR